jgi:hypothetical protein
LMMALSVSFSTDIRAAAPEARFDLTEVKWSIYPFGGSTIKLIQRAGLCRGCSGSVEGRARRRSDRAAGRGGGRSRAPSGKPGATFLRRDLDYELGVFRVVPRENR